VRSIGRSERATIDVNVVAPARAADTALLPRCHPELV